MTYTPPLHEIIDTSDVDIAAVRKALFALGAWPSATAVGIELARDWNDSDEVLALNVAARRLLTAQGKRAEPLALFASLRLAIRRCSDPDLTPKTVAQAWLDDAQPKPEPVPPLQVLISLSNAVLYRDFHPGFTDPEMTAKELRAKAEEQIREAELLAQLAVSMRDKSDPPQAPETP